MRTPSGQDVFQLEFAHELMLDFEVLSVSSSLRILLIVIMIYGLLVITFFLDQTAFNSFLGIVQSLCQIMAITKMWIVDLEIIDLELNWEGCKWTRLTAELGYVKM